MVIFHCCVSLPEVTSPSIANFSVPAQPPRRGLHPGHGRRRVHGLLDLRRVHRLQRVQRKAGALRCPGHGIRSSMRLPKGPTVWFIGSNHYCNVGQTLLNHPFGNGL